MSNYPAIVPGVKPFIFARIESRLHVAPNGSCLDYLGAHDDDGYGQLTINGKRIRAHRFAWEVANEAKIPKGMFVLHSCDRPSCCNPRHLRLGTSQENVDDRTTRNRAHRHPGELSPQHKLKEEQVLEIKSRFRSGETKTEIARAFGVSFGTVSFIVQGKRWKYLEEAS